MRRGRSFALAIAALVVACSSTPATSSPDASSSFDAGHLDHPIVVGHGKKLFADGATVPLTLVSSTAFDTGVLHLVYANADN